jgi:diguanylate cyclase (GGDEF)-like protein
MDSVSTPDVIRIVLPAFYISAGITLWMGILAGVVGGLGRREPLYLAFSLLCFPVTGFLYFSAVYYSAASPTEAGDALRWQTTGGLLTFPAFFWFISLYSRQAKIRPWLTTVTIAFLLLAVINLLSPYSVRFTALEAVAPLHLPWGETLVRFHGTPHVWGQVLIRIAVHAVLFWALWRCVVFFRRGERRVAGFLAAYLVLQFAAIVQGALVDWGVVEFFYTAGFAFLAMVVLMSMCLGLDLRDQKFSLEQTTVKLRAEIDQRRQVEGRVQHLAYYDVVTGLPNRAWLHKRLLERLTPGHEESGALLLLDLDRFRLINDSYGNAVGDELLRSIAGRLTALLPAGCELARIGSDEFVILVAGQPDDERAATVAGDLAAAVLAALREAISVGERRLYVAASVGIVVFPENGRDADELLRKVNIALHEAKTRGQNRRSFFLPYMQEQTQRWLVLDRGLREAIERGELTLCYQPQFDHRERVCGVEALLRWHHAHHGVISPAEFIPVAEQSGLIHQLGEWVLREACDSLRTLSGQGVFTGNMAVNVSPWEFLRADYPAQVERVLAASGVEPDRLVLEITEGVLLHLSEQVIENALRLRRLGVQIAVDDFGTGYASLAYLLRLPLSQLKIDKLFVQANLDSAYSLIRVIADIGRDMQLQVVGEGVETEAQKTLLLSLGCHAIQGDLLCRPLARDELFAWLGRQAVRSRGTA